jgi:hypothetical protein
VAFIIGLLLILAPFWGFAMVISVLTARRFQSKAIGACVGGLAGVACFWATVSPIYVVFVNADLDDSYLEIAGSTFFFSIPVFVLSAIASWLAPKRSQTAA